jgi:hypothetical protein
MEVSMTADTHVDFILNDDYDDRADALTDLVARHRLDFDPSVHAHRLPADERARSWLLDDLFLIGVPYATWTR